MIARGRRAWLLLAAAVELAGCKRAPSRIEPKVEASWPAPVDDGDGACADVGGARVCWRASGGVCDRGVCVVARPLPDIVPSREGLRCTGQGSARACVDRARLASPFECDGARCVQRRPRLPDDGEWTCADAAGAVLCSGGTAPAGVLAGPPDPGWFCQPHGAQRLCLDLDPDLPDGRSSGWRCSYEQERTPARVCVRAPTVHVLGDACDAASPCVDGARCVAGRCMPPRPGPTCWLDGECPNNACRFGSCREDSP